MSINPKMTNVKIMRVIRYNCWKCLKNITDIIFIIIIDGLCTKTIE